ncbi:hypothetical protein CMI37_35410 [Candidatus Pacearchaeota archaeon]|nr:hypothetical protein [Candidatus Pacearchaeota archaeon]|tara:strand:- start:551 stop:1066 length:516 start_codon:yes stop_codon:yes gene_type:complete
MRTLILALLTLAYMAQPVFAARWARVQGGVVMQTFRGNRGVEIGGIQHGRGIFKTWTAQQLGGVGIFRIIVDAKPDFDALTERLRANRLSVGDVYANETWTVVSLSLRQRRAAARAAREARYRIGIGNSARFRNLIMAQFSKMRDDGVVFTAAMDAAITSWEAVNAAIPIP